jgi:O-antigen ligase
VILAQAVVVMASLLAIALPLVGVMVGFRRVLPAQVMLFPVAHVYAGGLALIGTIMALAVAEFWRRPRVPVPGTVVLVWLGWAALVIISLSWGPPTPRQASQTIQFALYGAVAVALTAVLRVTPGLRERLIRAMVASAFLLSLVMIYMFRGGLLPDGLPFVTIGPNEHSMVLILMGVVPALYLHATGTTREKVAAWVTIGVSLVAMNVSETRGGLAITLALVAGGLVYTLTSRRLWLSAALGLVVLVAVVQVLQTAGLMAMFMGTPSFSDLERLGLLQASLRLFLERPLFGWGWGTIDALMPLVPETVNSYPHAHNTYAHFAVEQGIAGLALLVLLFGHVLVVAGRRKAEGYHNEFLLPLLLGLSLIATSLIEDLFYGASRALAAVLMIALVHGFVPARSASDPAVEPRAAPAPVPAGST